MALMEMNGQLVDVPDHMVGAMSPYGSPATVLPGSMFSSVQGLSAGPTAVPAVPGATLPNPYAYTSYNQAGGFGKYVGANAPLFGAVLSGVSQLGNLYLGIKNLGLASKAFKLQKEAYKTNLANQTSSYNTQVRDRIAGRSYATEAERQAALDAALLPIGG